MIRRRETARRLDVNSASDVLGDPLRPKVMVESQAAAHYRVLFPPRCPFGKRDLRFQDFPEQGIFRCFLLCDFVVNFELLFEDFFRCLVELDVVLRLHLPVVGGIPINCLPSHIRRCGFDRILDDSLHLVRQGIVFPLVEQYLELLRILVIALQHADLGNVGEAEHPIRGGVVELGRIK